MEKQQIKENQAEFFIGSGRAIYQRLGLLVGWFLVALIIYGSLAPTPVTATAGIHDKLQHFGAYFICMAWFAQILGNSRRMLFHALFLSMLAVLLEFAQTSFGHRVFETADMFAGMAGVACAMMAPKGILDSSVSRVVAYKSKARGAIASARNT